MLLRFVQSPVKHAAITDRKEGFDSSKKEKDFPRSLVGFTLANQ